MSQIMILVYDIAIAKIKKDRMLPMHCLFNGDLILLYKAVYILA